MPSKEVLDFIQSFKFADTKAIEETFSCGKCYWFALILSERFLGTICYNPIDNHFVTLIDGNFYDINGVYQSSESLFTWEAFVKYDELQANIIARDCMN